MCTPVHSFVETNTRKKTNMETTKRQGLESNTLTQKGKGTVRNLCTIQILRVQIKKNLTNSYTQKL